MCTKSKCMSQNNLALSLSTERLPECFYLNFLGTPDLTSRDVFQTLWFRSRCGLARAYPASSYSLQSAHPCQVARLSQLALPLPTSLHPSPLLTDTPVENTTPLPLDTRLAQYVTSQPRRWKLKPWHSAFSPCSGGHRLVTDTPPLPSSGTCRVLKLGGTPAFVFCSNETKFIQHPSKSFDCKYPWVQKIQNRFIDVKSMEHLTNVTTTPAQGPC